MTATHWEQLAAAAQQIEETVPFEWDDFDPATASAFLQRNAEAIDTAARLLQTRSAAPFRLEKECYDEVWPQIVALRQLARALRVRSQLAEYEGDSEVALTTGVQLFDLAGDVRRNSLLVGGLVSGAIAGTAQAVLRKMRGRLDVAQRRRLIDNLFRQEVEFESLDTILSRDLEWEIATEYKDDGKPIEWNDPTVPQEFREWFAAAMKELGRRPPGDRTLEYSHDNICIAKRRLLIIDLALRNWQEAIGTYPAGLGSLVPHELPKLPLDPFSQSEFIYRRQGDSFLLYSVGPKRFDAGGQFGSQADVTAHRADLNLDGAESS
jgi:hypothetical protein